MKRKIILAFVAVVAVIGISAWWLSAPFYADVSKIRDADRTPGSVIAVEPLGGHNKIVWRAMLWWAGLPVSVPVSDGTEMFRVRYWSQLNGQPVEASGLMALPYTMLGGETPRGMAMYFHGTNPYRGESPSSLSDEGQLVSAIFGGGGYILLAPDYIGLGTSRAQQTYLLPEPTAAAARDLVIASQRVAKAMKLATSPNLYLTGFSQGGYSTAVVQRSLEATPLPGVTVKGAASVSGAFDLARISIPYAFKNNHSFYLAYLAHSYASQYRQPLESLLTPKYAALVPKLYDGDQNPDTILAALPKNPRDMFLPKAMAEIDAGQLNWFMTALTANEAYSGIPKAPLRLYFGDKDTDVSPQDSKHFQAIASKAGGNIRLMPVGPYDHTGTAYRATPQARLWFDELSGQGQAR
jgi:hypothetical protein